MATVTGAPYDYKPKVKTPADVKVAFGEQVKSSLKPDPKTSKLTADAPEFKPAGSARRRKTRGRKSLKKKSMKRRKSSKRR